MGIASSLEGACALSRPQVLLTLGWPLCPLTPLCMQLEQGLSGGDSRHHGEGQGPMEAKDGCTAASEQATKHIGDRPPSLATLSLHRPLAHFCSQMNFTVFINSIPYTGEKKEDAQHKPVKRNVAWCASGWAVPPPDSGWECSGAGLASPCTSNPLNSPHSSAAWLCRTPCVQG